MRNKRIKPLYRKKNTKARGVCHKFGGDFKNLRNKKRQSIEQINGSMHGKKQRGLDYTPLFQFLLSKVGNDWAEVLNEAKFRLNKTEPIYWIVSLETHTKKEYIRVGQSTYFSGLYIDDQSKLQLVNPDLEAKHMIPFCDCCTHTLNGKVFGKQ
ncbi:MAG: hypothetical protein ACPGTP_04450 [Bacteroidia bacterium]